MGSYTELSIDGYPLLETKSEVVPEVMTIFRETDRRDFTRAPGERNELVLGTVDPERIDEAERVIAYVCKTSHAVDRLNVMGFTLRRAREDFEALRNAAVEKFASWANDGEDTAWFQQKWDFLKRLTFDD